jgi:hypothetical protein
MLAKVVKFNALLPTAQAVTGNGIAIAFAPPMDGSISLSDELEFDLETVDCDQGVLNVTNGKTVRLRVEKQNIHDMRLPGGHGSDRFPTLERRRGA